MSTPIDFRRAVRSSAASDRSRQRSTSTRARSPLVPRPCTHLALSAEGATDELLSSYAFVKLVLQGSFYKPVPRGHIIGFHVFGGALLGGAPIFDRFFIGDMNLFLPPRALGMNFSTQPSRDLLGTSIAGHRYDNFAGRLLRVRRAVAAAQESAGLQRRRLHRARRLRNGQPRALSRSHALRLSAWPLDVTGDLGVRLDTDDRRVHAFVRERAGTDSVLTMPTRPSIAEGWSSSGRRRPAAAAGHGARGRGIAAGAQDRNRARGNLWRVGGFAGSVHRHPNARRLTSGFSSRVLIRVYLRRAGDPSPSPSGSSAPRSSTTSGTRNFACGSRAARARPLNRSGDADQAIAAATSLLRFPIADGGLLQPGQRYFLAVRGDLNPLSQELQAEVRHGCASPRERSAAWHRGR